MPPSISVIIATYNRAHYLAECVRSILGQTISPCEVILVNDGSTDETHLVVESFGDRVTCLEQPNSGKSTALNKALPRVSGDYVWIFDDDDVALPDALERFVRPLEADDRFGYSYSTHYNAASTADHHMGQILGESTVPEMGHRGPFLALLQECYLGGAKIFARTECYRQVGPFDERLIRGQDYDMAIRIAAEFEGVRIAGPPTYLLRKHDGVRGGAGAGFDPRDAPSRYSQYNQLIFRKVLDNVPIERFISPGVMHTHPERAAQIARFALLAPRLGSDDVAHLLDALAVVPGHDAVASAEELALLRYAVSERYMGRRRLIDDPRFLTEVNWRSKRSPLLATMRSETLLALVGQRPARRPTRLLRQLAATVVAAWRVAGPSRDPESKGRFPGPLDGERHQHSTTS